MFPLLSLAPVIKNNLIIIIFSAILVKENVRCFKSQSYRFSVIYI